MEKSNRNLRGSGLKGEYKNSEKVGIMPIPDITKISLLMAEPAIPSRAPDKYYLNTLLRWLLQNKIEQKEDKSFHIKFPWLSNDYHSDDYEIRHNYFPPDPEEKLTVTKWSRITNEDLSERNLRLGRRSFPNATSHIVFLICILDTLRTDLTKFISMFAERMNIQEFLKEPYYEGEIKTIKILKIKLQEFLDDKELQLIPSPLYHHNWAGYLMSELIAEMHAHEENVSDEVFEFGFSKSSSDVFTESIIDILNKRKNLLAQLRKKPFRKRLRVYSGKDSPSSGSTKNLNEQGEKKIATININTAIIETVCTAIEDYLSAKDFGDLKRIFKGKSINKKLHFKGPCIKLVDVFYQLHEEKKIISSKINTKKWLCLHFTYEHSGISVSLSEENVRKILYGQNQVAKRSRIEIKESSLLT